MRGGRWDWRYAAAGLGWGTAVGALTGLLFVSDLVIQSLVHSGPGAPPNSRLLGFVVLGALVGTLPGALIGLIAGVLTGLTAGGITDPRSAARTAFVTSLVAAFAAGVVLPVAFGVFSFPMATWAYLVILIAATLGAWLMARTARSLAARAADRGSPSAITPPAETQVTP